MDDDFRRPRHDATTWGHDGTLASMALKVSTYSVGAVRAADPPSYQEVFPIPANTPHWLRWVRVPILEVARSRVQAELLWRLSTDPSRPWLSLSNL
jgi:hypothetical protein